MGVKVKLPDRTPFGKSEEQSTPAPTQQLFPASQPPTLRADRHGTVCLWGFGIEIRVHHGHLVLSDGVGRDRHTWRFARVGSGLKRLVVISDSGFITLDALRWIFDQQKAAFVMLDRSGNVVASTGPTVGLDDARLRRAQALARQTAVGLEIARELIGKKLEGQECVARDQLKNSITANMIARFRKELTTAKTIETVALLESLGAAEYWRAWEGLQITFPRADLRRTPEHWLRFRSRKSPISNSQRLSVDPMNSTLNFLYGSTEAEARLALSAVGARFPGRRCDGGRPVADRCLRIEVDRQYGIPA
jgi:CRISPR/Cas system-associated endonuclease Cas1